MRPFIKPVLIFGFVVLIVVAVSWVAFPGWRAQPGGWATLIGVAAAGVVAFAKGVLDAYKIWVEIEEKKKPQMPVSDKSHAPAATGSVTGPVTVNTGGGPAQLNTGTAERMVQAQTYIENQLPTPEKSLEGSSIPPSHAPAFIDRGPIMDELRRRIRERRQSAIVGVGGMGGVGKTELARYLAAEFAEAAPASVLWLDVADRPLGDVHQRLARALGVPLPPLSEPQRDYEILCAAFQQSPVRLLVLDDIRRAFLPSLRYCLPPSPPCAVLVTSRLHLPDVPAGGMLTLDVMTETQALDLLRSVPGLDEAVAREPDAAQRLIRLCAYHPLALDLASRRLLRRLRRSPLPLADFTAQLTNRLEQLQEGDARLQSLRANFDLSYAELSPEEQGYFRRLAVCAETGFTPALAAALWQGEPQAAALPLLERLSDVSLVLPPERAAGRWRLHDLLRDYAVEQLCAAGEETAMQRRFAAWLIALFEENYTVDLDAMQNVLPELDNLRAAADWAAGVGEGELLAQLATTPRNWLYNVFRPFDDWQRWLTVALQAGVVDPQLRANVLQAIGDVQQFRKEMDAALGSYQEALRLFRAVGAKLGEANVYSAQGQVYLLSGQQDKAKEMLANAIGIYETIGSRYSIPAQIGNYGWALLRANKFSDACPYFEQAVPLFEAIGLDDYAQRHHQAALWCRQQIQQGGGAAPEG